MFMREREIERVYSHIPMKGEEKGDRKSPLALVISRSTRTAVEAMKLVEAMKMEEVVCVCV